MLYRHRTIMNRVYSVSKDMGANAQLLENDKWIDSGVTNRVITNNSMYIKIGEDNE